MKKIMEKVSGIFIPVTDMQRSIEWYTGVFGLEIIDQSDICTGLAFSGEATILSLWKVEKPQPTQFDAGGYQIPYYNFESFDIEFSYNELRAANVQLSQIYSEDGIKHFDCFDPDGNRIGIVEELASSPYYSHKQNYRKSFSS